MPKKAQSTPVSKAVAAAHGEKMIELKIRLWTDGIAKAEGKIVPKHAATAGVVRMEPNDAHGIVSKKPVPFHSLLDIGSVIEKVLLSQGIILHSSNKVRKYYSN